MPTQGPPADEATRARVRLLVQEAGLLLERGDKAGAIAKLLQAQQIRPDPSLDYNLGIAYGEWGRPAEAAEALERFCAKVAKDAVLRERIEDAKQRLSAYRKAVGRVAVQLSPGASLARPGTAMVIIDNRTLGPAPLAGQYLAPGAHEVRVTSPGARDYIVSVEIGAGEERTISAQLVAIAPPGGLGFVPQKGPAPDPPLYKKWWLWTAIGSGVVLFSALIGAGAAGRFNHLAPGSDLDALDVAR